MKGFMDIKQIGRISVESLNVKRKGTERQLKQLTIA